MTAVSRIDLEAAKLGGRCWASLGLSRPTTYIPPNKHSAKLAGLTISLSQAIVEPQ